MANFIRMSFLAIVALASGCSSETAKRTAFETLQNVREQECLKNRSASDCGKRDSYDDYQRKRKELEPSQ
jgi:hypothetical protein